MRKTNKQTNKRKTPDTNIKSLKKKKTDKFICPVCKALSSKGSFQCGFCEDWAHFACGGYAYREIVHASRSTLRCNNCKEVSLKCFLNFMICYTHMCFLD